MAVTRAVNPSVWILLKDKNGLRFGDGDPWQCKVSKGEFVTEIQKDEPVLNDDDKKPAPNYRLYRDDAYVVFHAWATDVAPLQEKEYGYLLAIEEPAVRLQEYLRPDETNKMKMDLVVGDVVMFKMKVKPDATSVSFIKGVIRYIGPIQERMGTHFGIEIQEDKYRGKGTSNGEPYFHCGPKDAVFIAIDMITKKSQFPISEKPSKDAITSQPSGKDPHGGLKVKEKLRAIVNAQTTSYARAPDPSHQSKFKVGDRVILKSVKEEVFNGTVKWVGSTRVQNEGDSNLSTVAAVGVDVDKRIDCDKHFPGMCLNITGSRNEEVFKVGFTHTRLFLPEEYGLVLHASDYARQKQKDHALQWEVKKAKEYGLSLEEFRSQKKYLEKANRDKEQEKSHHQMEWEEDCFVGVETIQTGQPLSEQRQEEERAYELAKQHNQHDDHDRSGFEVIKGGVVSNVDDNYLHVGSYYAPWDSDNQQLHAVREGLRFPESSSPKAHHNSEKENYKSLISSHDAKPPPTDPHRQFTIGSMVCINVQRGEPCYGVLQWVGTVPNFDAVIAGVELERPLRDGTDGTWRGIRFFTCPPGRAYFCPMTVLRQDTRYLDQGQQKSTETDATAKLKEEISQLQVSIKTLQLEKENLQKATQEQIKREEQKWRDDKQQLLEENKQLRQHFEQEREQLEADKEKLMRENRQLKEENKGLMYELTDLREAHNELERETRKGEEIQAQLQSQAGLLSIENMRLKGQVKQLEESSATDIKYWEVSYKQVSTNRVTLGSGGWGKVEVGLLHGQKVAVKMLHSEIKSSYYNQLVRREISMLAKVRHPNLLLFIAGVLDHPSGSPIIITELLDTSLRKAYTDRLIANNRVRISIMRDVAAALNYIHCQKESIIHRDVSSANVLLEARGEGNWKGKLSDFGSANLVQFSTTTAPGAIPYAAPEVPHNQTTKMDVYSYGILLCEVLLSEFPFKERFPDMLQSLSSSWPLMHQLILSCTKHSVTDRVDMKYVLDTFNEQFSSDASIKKFVPLQ